MAVSRRFRGLTRSGLIFEARPNFGAPSWIRTAMQLGHLTRFPPIFGPYGARLGNFWEHFVPRHARDEPVFRSRKFLSISTKFMYPGCARRLRLVGHYSGRYFGPGEADAHTFPKTVVSRHFHGRTRSRLIFEAQPNFGAPSRYI